MATVRPRKNCAARAMQSASSAKWPTADEAGGLLLLKAHRPDGMPKTMVVREVAGPVVRQLLLNPRERDPGIIGQVCTCIAGSADFYQNDVETARMERRACRVEARSVVSLES